MRLARKGTKTGAEAELVPGEQPTEPRRAGRPLTLTPELQQELYDALRLGQPIRRACRGLGVNYGTFKRWCRRGRAGEEPFATFWTHINKGAAAPRSRYPVEAGDFFVR
jgi:hypothetical protein